MSKSKAVPSKGEKTTENKKTLAPKRAGKTAKEIVRRHLNNKQDRITKKDFENLKIDLSLPKDKGHRPLKIRNDKQRPKDADKDKTITTPWDVISK